MGIIKYDGVYLSNTATVVGKLEHEGPLGAGFDAYDNDPYFSKDSWEQAESEMVRRSINLLLAKEKLKEDSIDILIGGDLLNQCTATGFAAKAMPVPFLGIYGACSTAAEAFIIGSLFVQSGNAKTAIACASSHFCSSERQFRFPLEYGNQRAPVSQNTVTGAGTFLITSQPSRIKVSAGLVGKVIEFGITDANNMGAAMANAAVDTILRYFDESGESADSYDIIATGDLGREGFELATELFSKCGFDPCGRLTDCGMLMYDYEKQDVNAGASGCGCSACVLGSLFYRKLLDGEANRIIVVGTGALHSPKTTLQKQPIPAIAHLIVLERA